MLEAVGTVTAEYCFDLARNRPVISLGAFAFPFGLLHRYDNGHKVDLAEDPFLYRLTDWVGINRLTLDFLFVTPKWRCSEEHSSCGGERL